MHAYQDLYFLTDRRRGIDTADTLYRQARNDHLYARRQLAEQAYRTLITKFPQHPRREDAQLHLGALLAESGQPDASREELEDLLTNVPATPWRLVAEYYLGRDYEALGDLARAQRAYTQVAGNLDLDGSWRLAQLVGSHAVAPNRPPAATTPGTSLSLVPRTSR